MLFAGAWIAGGFGCAPMSGGCRCSLGCVAGAAGVARLHDYLRGLRTQLPLVSVELCSLTHPDIDAAGLVGSALFADGAAAVVAAGGKRAPGSAPTGRTSWIRAAIRISDSLRTMGIRRRLGWFELVPRDLAADEQYLGNDVTTFPASRPEHHRRRRLSPIPNQINATARD